MRYLYFLLFIGLVGCNETTSEGSSEESTVKEATIIVSDSDDSGKMKQPRCEDIDGLEVSDFDRVPAGFNGLAYCCVEGKVDRLCYFKDGKNDGIYREWNRENGQLEEEINIKNGKRDGVWRTWYKNGQLKVESSWKDDKWNGIKKGWYENGQLRYEANYKDGKRDGVERRWHKNGQLMEESNFKDGIYDGLHRGWHDDGRLRFEDNYKDGELLSGEGIESQY